jgi:hypothetical protein
MQNIYEWGQDLEKKLEEERQKTTRLLTALHDAIRRPMGVIPQSADEFYSAELSRQAEQRRMDHPRRR